MRHHRTTRTKWILLLALLAALALAPTVLGGIATSPLGLKPPTPLAGLGSCPLGSVHASLDR